MSEATCRLMVPHLAAAEVRHQHRRGCTGRCCGVEEDVHDGERVLAVRADRRLRHSREHLGRGSHTSPMLAGRRLDAQSGRSSLGLCMLAIVAGTGWGTVRGYRGSCVKGQAPWHSG